MAERDEKRWPELSILQLHEQVEWLEDRQLSEKAARCRALVDARIARHSVRDLLRFAAIAPSLSGARLYLRVVDERLDAIMGVLSRCAREQRRGTLAETMYANELRNFDFASALQWLDQWLEIMTPHVVDKIGFLRYAPWDVRSMREQLRELEFLKDEQEQNLRATAFMMAAHPRLGSESLVATVEEERLLRDMVALGVHGQYK